MKYEYKPVPLAEPNAAFPHQKELWKPFLNIALIYRHNKSSKAIQCLVDSGADYCLFHAGIGAGIGIDVLSGMQVNLGGFSRGIKVPFYFHKVKLLAAGESFDITAGFSDQLSCLGLLGQIGFFDNFSVNFDYTPHPPCFEIQRIPKN